MFRICLVEENEVNETGDVLLGAVNDAFVNSQYTHVKVVGCDEIMEAEAVYGKDGKPLVFIGLDVTKEYKEWSVKKDKELASLTGSSKTLSK